MQVFGVMVLFLVGVGATTDNEMKEFLFKHNELRALHSAPAMTWNPKIASFAQDWCNKLKSGQESGHSDQTITKYGENLYKGWSSADNLRDGVAQKSVQTWYDEENDYDFADHSVKSSNPDADIGHFTQVVWKNALELGCAISNTDTKENGWFIVWTCCNYSPAGNYVGQNKENVLPLKEGEGEEDEIKDKKKDKKAQTKKEKDEAKVGMKKKKEGAKAGMKKKKEKAKAERKTKKEEVKAERKTKKEEAKFID